QPAVGAGLEQLVERALEAAAAQLQAGLCAQRPERVLIEPRDRRSGVELREAGERGDAGALELEPLRAAQVRDQRQVVVGAALVLADVPPGAELTRGDRVRVGGLGPGGKLAVALDEQPADAAGVCVEILG